ncbi:MAG TPA: cytochrome b/b6 domain-containing protein [Acetobacteraceae bacterium]|nr:cytochrome b/b6 domain-containing protein [Acetobacteraceae bacterium]
MSGRQSLQGPAAGPAWQDVHYDRASIVFHWATAALIGINWLLGQGFFLFPRGTPRGAALTTHTLIGLTIGAMLLARITWRLGPGRRLAAEPGLLGTAAKAVHGALYVLIGITVLAGASRSFGHGYHFYGMLLVPPVAFLTHGLLGLLGHLHTRLADLLIILAGLHALAAIAHHVVLGDFVLLRMAPFLPVGLRRAQLRSAPLAHPGAQSPRLAPRGAPRGARDGGG